MDDKGYPLPETTPEAIYVCVPVPNADWHRRAFLAQIYELTKPWNWQGTEEEQAPVLAAWLNVWLTVSQQLDERVEGGCVDCGEVAECIEESEAVRNAISAIVNTAIPGSVIVTIPADNGENTVNINGNADCTDNGRYGVAYEVTEHLNRVVGDWLDEIQQLTDSIELGGELADNIPIIGAFISTAYDAAQWLLSELINEYDIAWNQSSHDAVACAVYCRFDGCELTLSGIAAGYRDVLDAYSPPGNSTNWNDWIAWLVSLSLSGNNVIVAAAHLFVVEVYLRASSFWGTLSRTLQIATAHATPTPLPSGGCGCTQTWCYYLDYEQATQGFSLTLFGSQTFGWYDPGNGWNSTNGSGYSQVTIERSLAATVTKVELETTITGGVNNNEQYIFFDSISNIVATQGFSGTGTQVLVWQGNANITKLGLGGYIDANGRNLLIKSCKVYGTGTNPFGSDNCP